MIELAQHGIYAQPAQNDQVAGIERVKSWLHANRLFFIERLCPLTIKQMKSYRWAKNTSPTDGSARKERVYKKDDELPDCLRYALMTWPILPKAAPADTKRDISSMPPDVQRVIERERKADAAYQLKEDKDKESTVGDFYL